MEAIQKSAEHHFLITFQKLRKAPNGWALLHFALSKRLISDKLLKNVSSIENILNTERDFSLKNFNYLKDHLKDIHNGFLYIFEDNDIVILAPYRSDFDKEKIKKTYAVIAKQIGEALCDFKILDQEIYKIQKLSDEKFLSAKAMAAYWEMSDKVKINSLPLRREKREYPLVQVIEDDRFSASYVSGILSREYDLVLSRTGEDGILHYIENAPDIIFIDIHLPGLNGHKVLSSLKAIDSDVFAVMLSADTVKDNILKSSEGGANSFLKKPFSKDRIINIVKNSPFVRATVNKNASSLRTH